MVTMVNDTGLQVMESAMNIVLAHYRDASFVNRIRTHQGFKNTDDTAGEIAQKIDRAANQNIQLVVYTTINPWSSAQAYTDAERVPQVIHFNMRQIQLRAPTPLTIAAKVETLMHEFMHCLGYEHGTNRAGPTQEMVPAKAAAIFVTDLIAQGVLPREAQPGGPVA